MDLRLTSIEGTYNWIIVTVLLLALLAGVAILASWLGWIPPIDRLDEGGAVAVPALTALAA